LFTPPLHVATDSCAVPSCCRACSRGHGAAPKLLLPGLFFVPGMLVVVAGPETAAGRDAARAGCAPTGATPRVRPRAPLSHRGTTPTSTLQGLLLLLLKVAAVAGRTVAVGARLPRRCGAGGRPMGFRALSATAMGRGVLSTCEEATALRCKGAAVTQWVGMGGENSQLVGSFHLGGAQREVVAPKGLHQGLGNYVQPLRRRARQRRPQHRKHCRCGRRQRPQRRGGASATLPARCSHRGRPPPAAA
jgi:hypothetical protein